jgi:hypothetical protein
MLFANWLSNQIAQGVGYSVLFIAVVILCAKKVKDAVKKATAARACRLIERFFK